MYVVSPRLAQDDVHDHLIGIPRTMAIPFMAVERYIQRCGLTATSSTDIKMLFAGFPLLYSEWPDEGDYQVFQFYVDTPLCEAVAFLYLHGFELTGLLELLAWDFFVRRFVNIPEANVDAHYPVLSSVPSRKVGDSQYLPLVEEQESSRKLGLHRLQPLRPFGDDSDVDVFYLLGRCRIDTESAHQLVS